ncbi:hypothetical protein DMENIID0001_076830 [Sergentomyia squamirostris]
MDQVELCYFSFMEKCGKWTGNKRHRSLVYDISELNNSVKEELAIRDPSINITEKELIENRANVQLPEEAKICDYHRHTLGLSYRPKKQCIHPDHKGASGGMRHLSISKWKKMNEFTVIPFGSYLCSTCQKKKICKDTMTNCEDENPLELESNDDAASMDSDYEGEIDLMEENKKKLDEILKMVNVSPLKIQCTARDFNQNSEETKEKIRRHYKKFISAFKNLYADTVSPGDPKGLKKYLGCDSEEEQMSIIQLKNLFDRADSSDEKAHLIRIAAKHFCHQDVTHIFEVSSQEYYSARKMNLDENLQDTPMRKLRRESSTKRINYQSDEGNYG